MADEIRTDTPGLARRIAQFDIEGDVYIHLAYDPRLRFYIAPRWWVNERFDVYVHMTDARAESKDVTLPHLEVNVGKRIVTIYRPMHLGPTSLAIMIEVLGFARAVLVEA